MARADIKIKELSHQLHRANHGMLALQHAEKMLEETQQLRQDNAQLKEILTNAADHISGLERTIMALRENIDRGVSRGGSSDFDRRPDIC